MWAIAGVGLLTVVTLVVVGQVVFFPPEPPRPSLGPSSPTPSETATTEPQPTFERPTDRPLMVFYAGDSLTQGAYSTTPALSFRGVLNSRFAQTGETTEAVVGQSGQTVAQAATAGPTEPTPSDIAIIEYGTNDVAQSTPEAFAVDYPTYLDRVRAASPDARLICAGAWNTSPNVAEFDATIRTECENRGGTYVPLHGLYEARSTYRASEGTTNPDGFVIPDNAHPNDAGHAAIASAIGRALWQ